MSKKYIISDKIDQSLILKNDTIKIYGEKNGQEAETYTRFNIYDLGQVLLDDHRSKESFMEKYKFTPSPVITTEFKKRKIIEKEQEL